MKPLSKRTFLRLSATCVAALIAVLCAPTHTFGAGSEDQTLVEGEFPNWATVRDAELQATYGAKAVDWASSHTQFLVDNKNHLGFELSSYYEAAFSKVCQLAQGNVKVVKYDLDTKTGLGSGCITANPQPTSDLGYQQSIADWDVVSSASRVIIGAQSDPNFAKQITRVRLTSEDTLKDVASICIAPVGVSVSGSCDAVQAADPNNPPPPPFPYVHGLSLDPVTNDLLVLTDPNNPTSVLNLTPTGALAMQPLGVAVADYHLSGVGAQVTVKLKWVLRLSPALCQMSLVQLPDAATYQIGPAYLSDNPDGDEAVFVPCSSGYTTTGATGASVVKVPLLQQGSCLCPDPTTAWVVPSPATAGGFIFDAKGERGFLLPSVNTAAGFGATVLVYDGSQHGSILGRFAIDDYPQSNLAPFYFGVDQDTGRFFAEDVVHGLRVVDGRRTPLNPGQFYPIVEQGNYPSAVSYVAIITPDARYPYPRLVLPLTTRLVGGTPRLDYLTVVADRRPVTTDPPSRDVDSGTFAGAIPPGALVTTTYAAHSGGYGIHTDYMGGYAGPLYNNNPDGHGVWMQYPRGGKTIDLLFGAVESATLADGAGDASASALADANGAATDFYRSCSDTKSPRTCVPSNCAPIILDQAGPDACGAVWPALKPPAPPTTSTAQAWPYRNAECSQPGPTPSESVDGASWYPEHSLASGAAAPPPVDLLDANGLQGGSPYPVTSGYVTGAEADANCTGPSSGEALVGMGRYACGANSPPSGAALPSSNAFTSSPCAEQSPVLTFASSETTTEILPPDTNRGLSETMVTAAASGIRLVLPGEAVVQIGGIVQKADVRAGGRPNTAHTTRSVFVHDVQLTSGNQTIDLCSGTCGGGGNLATLLDALNSVDPNHLYATFPSPDEPFGTEADSVSPAGSPGGFKAAIEASRIQQEGDKDFNDMSAFGGTESKLLPALRLVLFDPGSAEVNRYVIDLAGVQAQAQVGLDVEVPFAGGGDGGGTGGGGPAVDAIQAEVAAGVSPSYIGTAAPPATTSVAYHNGPLGVIERTLDGLAWLVRSPFAGVQMAAFLVMLGLPLALARRRWGWRGSSHREVGQ